MNYYFSLHKYIILIIILVGLVRCKTNYYATNNFKQVKKEIDTIVVLPSVVSVNIIRRSNAVDEMKNHTKNAAKSIYNNIYELLHKKYCIKPNIDSQYFALENDSIYKKKVIEVFIKANKLREKGNNSYEIPNIILEKTNNNKNRYFLINYYSGYYNSKYRQRDINLESFAISLGSVFLTGGHGILLRTSKPALSHFGAFLIDKKKKDFIYIDNLINGGDPRSNNEIKKLIYTNYKKMYY